MLNMRELFGFLNNEFHLETFCDDFAIIDNATVLLKQLGELPDPMVALLLVITLSFLA